MQHILHVFAFVGESGEQRLVRRILFTLALWHHRHRSRRHFAALDDRELDDIGLGRDRRRAECQKRFWQA
ncbi:MAG TPA: DUF1127 domain-containing protein [Reyranella sp.]|nr:DUF1127 domain-containing protein [Reyranella sp.]